MTDSTADAMLLAGVILLGVAALAFIARRFLRQATVRALKRLDHEAPDTREEN